MFIDKNGDSWYEECLQCGFSRELVDMVVVGTQPSSVKNSTGARKAKIVAG